jgi:Flp pilus assembly protein TadD
LCPVANACINEYEAAGRFRRAEPKDSPVHDLELAPEIMKNLRNSCAERYVPDVATAGMSFGQLNDYATCQIYAGKYESAIALLNRAESLSKDEYIIAANLGTAYEISGNLIQAEK